MTADAMWRRESRGGGRALAFCASGRAGLSGGQDALHFAPIASAGAPSPLPLYRACLEGWGRRGFGRDDPTIGPAQFQSPVRLDETSSRIGHRRIAGDSGWSVAANAPAVATLARIGGKSGRLWCGPR